MNRLILSFLLLAIALPSMADPNDDLLASLWEGDIAAVKKAIAKGINPNLRPDKQYTWIHIAIIAEFPEAIDDLAGAGVPLDAEDDLGQTPAHIAATEGDMQAIETLRRLGARLGIRDGQRHAPLDLARNGRHQTVVDALIQYQEEDAAIVHMRPNIPELEAIPAARPHFSLRRFFCCGGVSAE